LDELPYFPMIQKLNCSYNLFLLTIPDYKTLIELDYSHSNLFGACPYHSREKIYIESGRYRELDEYECNCNDIIPTLESLQEICCTGAYIIKRDFSFLSSSEKYLCRREGECPVCLDVKECYVFNCTTSVQHLHGSFNMVCHGICADCIDGIFETRNDLKCPQCRTLLYTK